MAKKKEAAAQTEGQPEAAKPKKEKIFTVTSDFTAIRKEQGQLTAKYNRIGRKVKELELPEEDTKAINDILQKSLEKASAEIVKKAFSGQDAEAFV